MNMEIEIISATLCMLIGVLRLTYLNLSICVSTCVTVTESFWKQIMT